MSMSDSAYLYSQKRSTEAQISAKNQQNQRYRQIISRLEPVKETLTTEKALFDTVKRKCSDNLSAPETWKGQNRTDFNNSATLVRSDNDDFYRQLDRALDEINNQITYYENQILCNYGVIGRLTSYLNSLLNAIENLVN